MFKKALSLLLSLMLVVTTLSVTALSVSAASTYVVAGSETLCGVNWVADAPENEMTDKGDGTYEKVYADVVAGTYQLKVVENATTWYGAADGGNVTFVVNDTCDVTVSFDPATQTITVTGDAVELPTSIEIESMRAVGAGDGAWLNGIGWDPAADENLMTEVAPLVYEITYEDIEAFDGYQFKFAANGDWTHNWGLEVAGAVTAGETELAYNGQNMTLATTYDLSNVTLRIDLSNFDYSTKKGAKMTVTVVDAEAPVEPTTAEPTEAPTTEAPTEAPTTVAPTEAPTTAAPTEVVSGLTVNATSNVFPSSVVTFSEDDTQVTITYFIESSKHMLNSQWKLSYDPAVLKVDPAKNMTASQDAWNFMPMASDAIVNLAPAAEPAGTILCNCTSVRLYKIANQRAPFVSVTFDVIGSGDTTVDLFVDVLTLSELDMSTLMTDTSKEETVVDLGVINSSSTAIKSVDTVVYEGAYNPVATNPVEQPTTVAPTTAAPTTEAPTTEVPTTEAPTTEEPTTAPVPGDATYVVAGSEELTGFMWVGDPVAAPVNVMAKDGDVYTLTFADAQPMTGAQIKVVENLADGTQNWIGNPDGSNVTFDITDVCDVTVTFNPATQAIEVTGTGVKMVTDLEVESMRAVGAGDGAWLNGIAWDPAADENLMTEITDGVYTITYEDVEAFDGYQFKFAANGSWTDNWGLAEAGAVTAGETALTYNGQNMSLATTYELSDVTITIDLTNFNYADKSGAKMFIEIVDANGEEPEPTTTEEPTTEAPTTEEPTTAPVLGDATYVVAGSEELTGFMWVGDPAAAPTNVMTKDGDVYTLTFVDAQPMTGAQIKVVENLADGTQNWIGNPDGSNVTFDITDVCDVTVTFNPATQAIEVTGTGVKMVTDLEVESMRTVGAGDGAWLNGIAWDPAADENLMTEITDGVYTITYEDVEAFDGYQFKFAANGSWADNWGLEVAGAVTEGETALKYNGENMSLSTTYELSDVTITIDLTNFNYADKSGAKMFIEVVDASGSEPEPTTVEPTTEAPTTEEPTTEAPTTEEPTTVPANALDITATSNLFPEATKTVEVADGETFVTVKYIVSEDMKLMNTQWVLNYDSTKLVPVAELNENMMPFATVGAMYVAEDGKIAGSCSSLNLYDIASGMSFVEATFKVVGTGETTVELVVEDLIASERNADGTSDETKEVVYVQAGEVAKTIVANTEIVVNAPVVEPTTVAPTTEAPVTEPTTVAPETEPTTEAPATEPTTEAGSTAAPDEDATSATDSTVKPGTADTPEAPDSNAVQTGNASMAIIILLVLVSASGVLFFARKRVK